jgi:hypothetical protein
MICSNCSQLIDSQRLELIPDTKICSTCAKNGIEEIEDIKGFMDYSDESTSELVCMSASKFQIAQQYFNREGYAANVDE